VRVLDYFMRKTVYLCLTTVVLATTALAQSISTTQAQQDEKVVVGTNLVTLNVIVTDSKGRYVKGLSRDQFDVYDNKVKQQIAHFSTDASPVSIGIVYEIHESATEKTRAMLAAIRQFTSTLGSEDDSFFLAFSEHDSFVTDFVPSADQVLEHLQFVKPGGPSSLYDSIYLAADRLRTSRNLKKALLVISDGQDTSSIHNYNKLRNRLRTLDAQLYAIGIADPKMDELAAYRRWFFEDITRQGGRRSFLLDSIGRAVLAEMSRVSGGATYFPQTESESELAGICTQIALELRQQYTLGFYSKAVDNNWHRVKVRVAKSAERSDLTLTYREGYQIAAGGGH
jgi:Ca-activated chloride channel homolog